jgi:hypothetical protein
VETATEVVQRVADVLTPARTAALGALVDRLSAALAPDRVEAVTRTADALRTRGNVVPRTLDALDRLLSSDRLERLGDGLDRLLAPERLDRLDVVLGLATSDRVERLLDLAADDRLGRLLDRLDSLLADDRVPRLVDRADRVLHDDRLSRLGVQLDRLLADEHLGRTEEVLGNGQAAAAMRLFVRLERDLPDEGFRALAVLLDRLPTLLTEERTAALAALADQAPRLVRGLEGGELPSAGELGRVPADLHALLELIDDLHQVASGMPGAGRARDRGEDPHPQVEDPQAEG